MRIARMALISWTLVALAFVASAVLWPRLPEQMATHFNAAGHPNGYMPRLAGAFFLPGIMVFVAALLGALPTISPKGFRAEASTSVMRIIQVSVLSFMFGIHMLVLLYAVGVPIHFGKVVSLFVGLLFIVLGNFMGKLQRNFFVGIRTPWTLADEEVWLRTHRFGGRLMVLAGLALLALAPFGWAAAGAQIFLVLGVALTTVLYSYWVYRRLHA